MKSKYFSIILTAIIAALCVILVWFYPTVKKATHHFVEKIQNSEPDKKADAKDTSSANPEVVPTPPVKVVEPKPIVKPVEKVEPAKEDKPAIQLPTLYGTKGAQELVKILDESVKASPQDAEKLIAEMEEKKLITKQDAEVLKAWAKENGVSSIEPVGTFVKDGKKMTRYRLVGDKGEDLLVDLEQPEQNAQAWKVGKITQVNKIKAGTVVDSVDSMQVAEGFVNALRMGDMVSARTFISGNKVSDVTIAGLCIVFAEGGYRLREQQPIRANFQNEKNAAYLVYLQSDANSAPAFVGIELHRDEKNFWRVEAVALDSLLSNYEQSADAEGGRYFPLVKNPQGGDSIALFFAFDDSSLTPRSLRQLGIVAELLKQNERKLDIAGHTDDVGGEKYNEKLSLRRANAVKEALIELGVMPGQISTQGMGMKQPRRAYSSAQDAQNLDTLRAENRRAEIYLDFK